MQHDDRPVIIDKRGLLEGARWHEGALWVSDIYLHEVLRIVPGEDPTVVATVPGEPSGLGWRPDGTLLINSCEDRTLRGLTSLDEVAEPGVLADLSKLAPYPINDMTVTRNGNAFIGQVGFNRHAGPLQDVGSPLLRVDPDNSVHVAADDLHVANGMVVTGDERTLIVAESLGHRLTAFDLDDDGTLRRRRVWAQFDSIPDGICIDAEGLVWVAFPHLSSFCRVAEGGQIIETISIPDKAVCCVLGGDDLRSLFLLCTPDFNRDLATAKPGARIEVAHVDTPAA